VGGSWSTGEKQLPGATVWCPKRALRPLACCFAADGPGLDPPMALQLLYHMFSKLLG
jgi:hypothetical protein